ncbi:MAG TPA: 30S ribosomal protein S4 [Tenericutes bacterium]|jgi:small subunit ribosomal protein S4|nr:30S ribosomal protein S4 [Mycoplasmatota bacterium]
MSRYIGPKWKIARRLGFSITETGKELKRRPYAPGQHGQARKKLSEYGLQLREKQKIRNMYGLSERQLRNTFEKARNMGGIHGEDFLRLLESRLDNLVYRIGFAPTRRAARQLVNHGHITVNGKSVDIPSYQVKPGDLISVKEKSRDMALIKNSLESTTSRVEFISYDDKKMEATYLRMPERHELNPEINEALIVEFYSR